MPLRALRLLQFPTTSESILANSLSFVSTLQLAAGKAWTRRVAAHSPLKAVRKRGVRTVGQCQAGPGSSEQVNNSQPGSSSIMNYQHPMNLPSGVAKDFSKSLDIGCSISCVKSFKLLSQINDHPVISTVQQTTPQNKPKFQSNEAITHLLETPLDANLGQEMVNVTYFDPQSNVFEPSFLDSYSDEAAGVNDHMDLPADAMSAPVTGKGTPTPHTSYLITPTSRSSLYRNLLYLVNMRKPPSPLPALVDYHQLYPEWHSVRSYNLLIDLSIRHHSYGLTTKLFRSLDRTNIPKNIETYRLQIRSLVCQGLWGGAWRYALRLQSENLFPRSEGSRNDIPFPIWLEFFRVPQKRRMSSDFTRLPSVVQPDNVALAEWQQLLKSNKPVNIPPLPNTSPYAIYSIVQLMLKTGNHSSALSLTEAYFKADPRPMNARKMLACLRIIHAHLAYCNTAKKGLPRFYQARRKLISLLKLHPSLRPSSRTLCLLFAMLQRAKHGGTVAWKHLAKFKNDWSPYVEDRRVLRRISQLALKERRMDIVKKISDVDNFTRHDRRWRLLESRMMDGLRWVPKAKHVRFPLRQIYLHNGREARLWFRHRISIQRKIRRIRRSTLPDGNIQTFKDSRRKPQFGHC